MLDFSSEEVAEILRLLDAAFHDELTLESKRRRVVFRRGAAGGWTQETHTFQLRPVVLLERAEEPRRNIALEATRSPSDTDVIEIRSSLPGTFYRAPKPGAAPFVEVESRVHEHSVVAIVETMKLMNSIHAGAKGKIVEICVTNGDFVEPTTVLMRLRRAGP